MHENSTSFSSRKIILMLLVLAIVAFAMVTNTRQAEAVSDLYTCTYYSDAAHTHAVGGRGGACCGGRNDWGVTSPYVTCHPLACTDVICGPID
jgi:hypothetical protein